MDDSSHAVLATASGKTSKLVRARLGNPCAVRGVLSILARPIKDLRWGVRSMAVDGVRRREFIRVVAGGAVLVPGLIAACSAPTPSASPTSVPASGVGAAPTSGAASAAAGAAPTAAGASGAKPSGVLPAYMPLQNGPKPDYASAGQQYEDGWDNYPMPPIQAWTKTAPGLGSTITAFSNAYNPPSTPLDSEPGLAGSQQAAQRERQLHGRRPGRLPGQDGHDHGRRRPARRHALPGRAERHAQRGGGTTNLPQFLQSKCADLTPLPRRATRSRTTPFLAAIPTYAWKNSGSAVNGHLYMLPIQRYVPGTALFKNTTYYDQEIGANYVPKDADDLKRVYQQLNRPQENRWATAAYQNTGLHILFYAALWGAPNNWALDASSGKLTKNFETPEFKAAVGYARDLYASGSVPPKLAQLRGYQRRASGLRRRPLRPVPGGLWPAMAGLLAARAEEQPALQLHPAAAIRRTAGRQAHALPWPRLSVDQRFQEGSDDRIKELLRIFDFLASPFGSQEDLLLQYGIKDVALHARRQRQAHAQRPQQSGRELRQLEVPDPASAGHVRAGYPGLRQGGVRRRARAACRPASPTPRSATTRRRSAARAP